MKDLYPLIIDVFSHILPPKYRETIKDKHPNFLNYPESTMWNMEDRFRMMDRFEGIVQVLTLGLPFLDILEDKQTAVDLARLGNDEMAELVSRYPERFAAGVASLPLMDIDESLKEIDRVVNDLRFRGIQICSPINDKPLDSPEFMPIFEKMHEYDLPVYIHPVREVTYPDYRTETESKYRLFSLFGWVYETTTAMARIACSGLFEKLPNLKIITHHCGAMVPYLEERIKQFFDLFEMQWGEGLALSKAPIEYFKRFYNDTALYGNTSALMCAYNFCGAEHMLFAADFPLGDSQAGYRNYRQTINAIDHMAISDSEKKLIFEDNARKLLRLPL